MPTYIYDTELCHSKGPWKKHSYIKKIGEGKRAIYIYNNDYNSAKAIKNHITEVKNNNTKLFGELYNGLTNNIAGKGSFTVIDSKNNKHKLSKEELIKKRANDVDGQKKFIKEQNKRIDTINSMSDKDSADFMSREKRLKENSKYWEKQKAKKAREERLAAAEKRKWGWYEEKQAKNKKESEERWEKYKKSPKYKISEAMIEADTALIDPIRETTRKIKKNISEATTGIRSYERPRSMYYNYKSYDDGKVNLYDDDYNSRKELKKYAENERKKWLDWSKREYTDNSAKWDMDQANEQKNFINELSTKRKSKGTKLLKKLFGGK